MQLSQESRERDRDSPDHFLRGPRAVGKRLRVLFRGGSLIGCEAVVAQEAAKPDHGELRIDIDVDCGLVVCDRVRLVQMPG
jgi:hypothetical protein